MKIFISKIIYRIICGSGDHSAQFDEQLRLIYADSAKNAFIKSKEIGELEQVFFFNMDDKLVTWEFVNVAEVYEITEYAHGAELFSRINEVRDGEAYCTFVHSKAEKIVAEINE